MSNVESDKLIENLIALNILERKDNLGKESDNSSCYYVLVVEAPKIELIDIIDELINDFINEKVLLLN